MSYIDKNLLPGEIISFRTKKHMIIFFYPLIWTIFALYSFMYMQNNEFLAKISFLPFLIGAIFWIYVYIEYATSEFVVTDKRVMMREGFFVRHTNETRLTAVAQVEVAQSLIGQLFNYGIVVINSFGSKDAFSLISAPYQFQKSVNQQIDKITK